MRHTIRGKRYIVVEPDDIVRSDGTRVRGRCWGPNTPAKRRYLACRKGQRGRGELDTWVHECLHACDWDDSEEAVIEKAEAIAGLLWKLGYRRVK